MTILKQVISGTSFLKRKTVQHKRSLGRHSGARQDIQMRQLCYFFRADVNYSRRVAQALSIEIDPRMLQHNQQDNPQPVTV